MSNYGQGIGFTSKQVNTGSISDAANGLSLEETTVVLGQSDEAEEDTAQLLNKRRIPLNGFGINFKGNNIDVVIDDENGYMFISKIGGVEGNYECGFDVANLNFQITTNDVDIPGSSCGIFLQGAASVQSVFFIAGHQDSEGNNKDIQFRLRGAANEVDLTFGEVTRLFIDEDNERITLGDHFANANGTRIIVDDAEANQVIQLIAANGIETTDPGSGPGRWKLGQVIAGAVALDAANYIEVEIDGVVRKILIAS